MPANDRQVGGDHYKNEEKFEHWDYVMALRLDYLIGVATKYVQRWDKKDGLKDLEKAVHYVQKRMELGNSIDRSYLLNMSAAAKEHYFFRFCRAAKLQWQEAEIIWFLSFFSRIEELGSGLEMLKKLIETRGMVHEAAREVAATGEMAERRVPRRDSNKHESIVVTSDGHMIDIDSIDIYGVLADRWGVSRDAAKKLMYKMIYSVGR